MFPRNSGYRPGPLLIVANFPIKEEMFEIINTLFGVNFSLKVPETGALSDKYSIFRTTAWIFGQKQHYSIKAYSTLPLSLTTNAVTVLSPMEM